MRRDYASFQERDAEIIVTGPDDKEAFRDYWERESLPFIGIPDPLHRLAKLYEQPVRLLKFGRMPMQLLITRQGIIHSRHEANGMKDTLQNKEALRELDELARDP